MTRLRELGLSVGSLEPGPLNAITDVAGVAVGHTTLIGGDGPLVVGRGPVRTGVTVVLPCPGDVWRTPLFAGWHRLNGNGEFTGIHWVQESGLLTSPVAITNTHSVGVVRDALVAIESPSHDGGLWFALPVVAETYDGRLNDINGMHVRAEHVEAAIRDASTGAVVEGSVGGGTGMICHGYKGGIGSASRKVTAEGDHALGVLVQANHGRRERFEVAGVPVGRILGPDRIPGVGPARDTDDGRGSIIVIVATDAPLLPHQLDRLAQRAGFGIARLGGVGEHGSGDMILAFSTANRGRLPAEDVPAPPPPRLTLEALPNTLVNPFFDAVVEATEEAILNAMLQANTMVGRDGITAHGLDPEMFANAMAGRA